MTDPRPLALVTGASAGIGRGLADILARDGHDLAPAPRREPELTDLARELKEKHGADSRVLTADLAAPDAGAQLAESLGGAVIEVLVNNAGFGGHGAFA